MSDSIASGFEFQLQLDGTIIMEFHDDEGKIINTQFVTGEAFKRVPLVAFIAAMATEAGPEVAKKLIRTLRALEEVEDGE
jgi:hypothetical protein